MERLRPLAWAAEDATRWWWPTNQQYWPPAAPKEVSIAAFIEAFTILGYEPCDDPALETGFEKIAIYHRYPLGVQHAARQLLSGKWTSKIGSGVDIEHEHPSDLEGHEYGTVAQYMRRRFRS